MRSWILVGMMGAGKSAVGRALALATSREFVDTDTMLQNRFGRPVEKIFEVYGESAFRDHETSILKSMEPGDCVVSTGGGIVVREANWGELKRLGHTLYLRARPETLIARLELSKKKRPLLQVEQWEERVEDLLESRRAAYGLADACVDVDDLSLDDVVAQVKAAFEEIDK